MVIFTIKLFQFFLFLLLTFCFVCDIMYTEKKERYLTMTKQNREKFTKKIWDDIFNTNDTSDKQTEYYNVSNYRDSRWYHRTERQSKQLSIIQCLDRIDSIIAYSPQCNKSLAKDILDKDLSSKYLYLKQYVDMFSYNFVLACIISQLGSIDKINTNGFTDDECLSYNSVVYKN